MDKSVVKAFSTFEESDEDDRRFWQSKFPGERLAALELMRQSAYGYDDSTAPRLQRVLKIVRGE